jgi:hypothetical protein
MTGFFRVALKGNGVRGRNIRVILRVCVLNISPVPLNVVTVVTPKQSARTPHVVTVFGDDDNDSFPVTTQY